MCWGENRGVLARERLWGKLMAEGIERKRLEQADAEGHAWDVLGRQMQRATGQVGPPVATKDPQQRSGSHGPAEVKLTGAYLGFSFSHLRIRNHF